MYQFIRSKYDTVEIVFITHDTEAREVDEKAFFSQGTSGGTFASTGLELTNETIQKRFHPSAWNIYCFECSDGDNFETDNEKFIQEATKLKDACQLFGYCEIEPNDSSSAYYSTGTLFKILQPLRSNKVRIAQITRQDDVWRAFKEILGGMKEVQ